MIGPLGRHGTELLVSFGLYIEFVYDNKNKFFNMQNVLFKHTKVKQHCSASCMVSILSSYGVVGGEPENSAHEPKHRFGSDQRGGHKAG